MALSVHRPVPLGPFPHLPTATAHQSLSLLMCLSQGGAGPSPHLVSGISLIHTAGVPKEIKVLTWACLDKQQQGRRWPWFPGAPGEGGWRQSRSPGSLRRLQPGRQCTHLPTATGLSKVKRRGQMNFDWVLSLGVA